MLQISNLKFSIKFISSELLYITELLIEQQAYSSVVQSKITPIYITYAVDLITDNI